MLLASRVSSEQTLYSNMLELLCNSWSGASAIVLVNHWVGRSVEMIWRGLVTLMFGVLLQTISELCCHPVVCICFCIGCDAHDIYSVTLNVCIEDLGLCVWVCVYVCVCVCRMWICA